MWMVDGNDVSELTTMRTGSERERKKERNAKKQDLVGIALFPASAPKPIAASAAGGLI